MLTRLTISGMTCAHCRARVEQVLSEVPGVWAAEVDLDGEWADVEYDDRRVAPDHLVRAVEAAGYGAEPVS